MNKVALYIPRPGSSYKMIQQGYVDSMRALGWKVYVGDPKTKLGCRQLIEKYNIKFIMTHSRYGIRQLPIDCINKNKVFVVIEAMPLNADDNTVDGPYEFAHEDEPDHIKEIENVLVYTKIEQVAWSGYMDGWMDSGVEIMTLPPAGNMTKAVPPTCSPVTDVAMVANFTHRPNILKHLIEPLFKRIDLLGYSYQAFGDTLWQSAGLNYNGPLGAGGIKLAHVYATAKVCPNVHTEKQVREHICVNERSFTIPLCGGLQVCDNPMVTKYLGSTCPIAESTTDYINKVIDLVEDQSNRADKIRENVSHVSKNHTYFNRLTTLFNKIGLSEFGNESETYGQRAAVRHCWEIDTRLSAEERGVPYEQQAVGTA